MEDKILGIQGLPSGNLEAGVGFIIIPKNIDIEVYKENVYKTGRVSIFGGYGHSNFHNVIIDKDVLQRIEFPEKVGDLGTPVLWINIPKHEEPVIVSCLKYDDDFLSLSEFRYRITNTDKDGNLVDLDLDGKKAKTTLNINGYNKKGELEININSSNNDGLFKINVDGKILERYTSNAIRLSEKTISNVVTDKRGVVIGLMTLNSDKDSNILEYEDIFGNKIYTNEDNVNIRADKSKKINFGDGSEPLVLAKTLKEILDEYDDCFAKMTVPTAFGPSGTRINEADFKKVRAKFENFFSKLTNSD